MSKNPLILAVIVTALGACSAAAQDSLETVEPAFMASVSEAAPPAVSCDVRADRTEHGVLIQGRAFADSDANGSYELVITKTGANESEINQAGPVAIAAGRSITLGETELNLERGARLHAVLTLRDADGVVCSDSLSL
jgi:hypothetical protein